MDNFSRLLAQGQEPGPNGGGGPDSFWGNVVMPPGIEAYGGVRTQGLILFANNIFKLLLVIGGLFALLNILLAGYGFLSAGDDPKKIEGAWKKIWQSLLGLLIIAGSFVLAAIFGWLIFHDETAILSPVIYGP